MRFAARAPDGYKAYFPPDLHRPPLPAIDAMNDNPTTFSEEQATASISTAAPLARPAPRRRGWWLLAIALLLGGAAAGYYYSEPAT